MTEKKRALLCDDTPLMQSGVKALLTANGFDVIAVEDGAKGYALLKQGEKFDIIFSDVEMPNMTGFELLARVRKDPSTVSVPFVLCTTLNKPEHIELGKKLGATSYIVKPMRPETLERALKNAGMK